MFGNVSNWELNVLFDWDIFFFRFLALSLSLFLSLSEMEKFGKMIFNIFDNGTEFFVRL